VLIFRELGDVKSGACALQALALVALDEGAVPRAEKLAGAAQSVLDGLGVGGDPSPRLAALRERQSPDWKEGARLSFEEAAEIAQAEA
jgi:hypothetical protein